MTGFRIRRVAVVATAMALLAMVGLFAGGNAGAGSAPVVVGGRMPEAPAIAGDRVVWADYRYGSFDIFLYEASTGSTTRITSGPANEIDPDIDGDTIVYAGYGAKGYDIYAYDIPSRTTIPVTNIIGDQMVPRISGAHVVWEDRYPSYTAQIWGVDLDGGIPFKIDSGYGIGKRRPRVSGDTVVYEDYPRGVAADSDVLCMTFPPGEFKAASLAVMATYKKRIAGTTAPEIVPDIDGRYIVWADGSGDDLDIKGYDLLTNQSFVVAAAPGEQASPVVDGAMVYWSDAGTSGRLRTNTYNITTGARALFDSYSVNEPAGLNAGGGGVAWLESLRDGWRVRALPGAPQRTSSVALGLLSPRVAAWQPYRLAQVSTGGDTAAPEIEFTSVRPGETMADVDAHIVATANEPLDPRSVTADRVTLSDADGNAVASAVRYSALTRSIEIVPEEPLGEGTYVLSIGPGLTDVKGNASSGRYDTSFSTIGILADVANPTSPSYPLARPSGLASVEVTWVPSSDDVAVAGYRVYRHNVPINLTNLASAEFVADVAAPAASVTTSTATGERAGKYTLYYVIRAYDTSDKLSPLSANVAPDPHGTYVSGANTRSCEICHAVHGAGYPTSWRALGAQSADACYLCHGDTSHATAYGYGSTLNIEASFWDYEDDGGTVLPATGSRHRNAYMDSEQLQCSSCHTSHKKPYDADSTMAYTKMLRRYDPVLGFWVYWRSDGTVVKADGTAAAATFDKDLCLSCHGTDTTDIARVGGATAYANSAGDHSSGYDTAATAHGPSTVKDDPAKSTADGPQVPCAACHNKHASAAARLVDYRTSNTQTAGYDQAGLCYACHVDNYAAEQSSGMSVSSNAYSAWNGRDVRAEFARVSHHPTSTADGLTCYSCHNTHNITKGASAAQAWQVGRVSDPDNIKTVWSGSVSDFCIKCHDAAPPTKKLGDSTTLRPYDVTFSSITAPFFPQWDKTVTGADWSSSRHNAVVAVSGCQTCHDPHGSNFQRLTAYTGGASVRANTSAAVSKEQNLCYTQSGCHSSGATGSRNVGTPFAQTYKHPVTTDDRHSDTENATGLGASNRHAECVDCHDPHAAGAGIHSQGSSAAGAALRGAIGVKPNSWPALWTAVSSGYATERMTGQTTDYESYVCLKCHSNYSTRGTTSGGFASTDVALEFNPNNASGHNVFGSNWSKAFSKGGSTWGAASTLSFSASGWTSTSAMTCSDCHSYNAAGASGPHGSSVRYILKYGSGTDDWWATTITNWTSDAGNMCAACHSQSHAAWVTGNSAHYTTCERCHSRIPHGWKRPRLLGYHGTGSDADSLPYVDATGVTGLIGIDLKNITDAPTLKGDCQTNCGSHSATPATNQW